MHIAVVGAGAIGSVLATALSRAGDEVTLILRSAAVPEGGSLRLSVTLPENAEQWAILPATAALSDRPDLIILAVQTQEITEAIKALGEMADIPMVVLQAGPHAPDLARAAGAQHVFDALPLWSAIGAHGQAKIETEGPLAICDTDIEHPALTTVRSSWPTQPVADVVALRWTRLFVTLPQILTALTDLPLEEILEDRRCFNSALALWREGAQILTTDNTFLAPWPNVEFDKLQRIHSMPGIFAARVARRITLPTTTTPLQRDLAHQKTGEADELIGVFIQKGTTHNIPTPALSTMLSLIQTRAQQQRPFSREELSRAVARL
jgi:ketopantoate reductase